MPSYQDPLLGPITECQWVSTGRVPIAHEVPVSPQDLPISPELHDFETVSARAAEDPGGYPWLTERVLGPAT